MNKIVAVVAALVAAVLTFLATVFFWVSKVLISFRTVSCFCVNILIVLTATSSPAAAAAVWFAIANLISSACDCLKAIVFSKLAIVFLSTCKVLIAVSLASSNFAPEFNTWFLYFQQPQRYWSFHLQY